jgi:hypothetical protein
MARLIFMHGPPACGKLTIAKELSTINSYKLFHNHLVVDLLLSVFSFGSEEFIRHRDKIWCEVIGDAIAAGTNMIFTFCPENTVDPVFPQRLCELVKSRGGSVVFIEVTCSEEIIESRMASQSRSECRKLTSVELFRQLKMQGSFDYPVIPSTITIDSAKLLPEMAAQYAADLLN